MNEKTKVLQLARKRYKTAKIKKYGISDQANERLVKTTTKIKGVKKISACNSSNIKKTNRIKIDT